MSLRKAIILSLIVHVIVFAALLFNFQFPKKEIKQNVAATPIKARAINSDNIKKQLNKLKQKKINKRNKEVERLRKLKKQEEDIRKKRIKEENKIKKTKQRQADAKRKRKIEEKKTAETKKKRAADDKARKKKAVLDKKKAVEKKKKTDAEKKRKADVERKRKKKIDEEKRRKEREKQRKIAEEKAAQEALEQEIEAQMAEEASKLYENRRLEILSELDKYVTFIRIKITQNWIEPEQFGYCVFRISLAPGGLVLGVSVIQGDKQHCDSGQRAIYKSEPLPVSKDPDVFAELKSIKLTLGEHETND